MRPEKLRMWAAAEELLAEVDTVVARVTRRMPNAADHLERSAESVLFNIAEGAGAYRVGLKTNAYEIARKEANEIRAVLRRLVIRKSLDRRDIERSYDLASMIIVMLTRAILSLRDPDRPNPRP